METYTDTAKAETIWNTKEQKTKREHAAYLWLPLAGFRSMQAYSAAQSVEAADNLAQGGQVWQEPQQQPFPATW